MGRKFPKWERHLYIAAVWLAMTFADKGLERLSLIRLIQASSFDWQARLITATTTNDDDDK